MAFALPEFPPDFAAPSSHPLVCPVCGAEHRAPSLAPGERASCLQCNAVLLRGSRLGPDAALALALTGLIAAIPALSLPFVTVSKLSNERVGVLLSGAGALWGDGLRLTSAWVVVCGAIAPLLLLGTLIAAVAPLRLGWRTAAPRGLSAVAHAVERWSMPEVHVLAVLVALVKLHTLVGVEIGWGFWCYIAMSFLTLLAWRSFDVAATAGVSSDRSP